MKRSLAIFISVPLVIVLLAAITKSTATFGATDRQPQSSAENNAEQMIDQGRQIFRFDTFGDEAYWTDQLQMQKSVTGLSPQTALALGLKVDADAVPNLTRSCFLTARRSTRNRPRTVP